jgi:pimeloyl-ACP methyl ester carboxylesterase
MPLYHTEAGRVETLEWGEGEEVWVLLHAAAAGPRSLAALAERLLRPERRIVAPFLAGYGGTERGDGTPIEAHVAVARAVLAQHEARRRVLLGHSMGGLVALLLAATGCPLDALVLYEPITLGLLTDDAADRVDRKWDQSIVEGFEAQLAAGDPEAGVAAFVEAWNEVAWSDLPAQVRHHLVRSAGALAKEVRSGSDYPLARHRVAAIATPTVILQGDASPDVTHRMTARLAALVPGARRVLAPGCGHMGPVRHADAAARAMFAAMESPLLQTPACRSLSHAEGIPTTADRPSSGDT